MNIIMNRNQISTLPHFVQYFMSNVITNSNLLFNENKTKTPYAKAWLITSNKKKNETNMKRSGRAYNWIIQKYRYLLEFFISIIFIDITVTVWGRFINTLTVAVCVAVWLAVRFIVKVITGFCACHLSLFRTKQKQSSTIITCFILI